MPRGSEELRDGREAYEQRAWGAAFEVLKRADDKTRLGEEDLERLAFAAALSGRDEEFLTALERLHNAAIDSGAPLRAARAAFWLGFRWLSLGEMGRGGGWISRAGRLVEAEPQDCVERGYLLLPSIQRDLMAGDFESAREIAKSAAEIGERFADSDLSAFARNLEGGVLVRQGQVDVGLALLDEAMLAVTTGDVSPLMAGLVYCSVIASCHRVFALDRAREWTQALSVWCDAQPELVIFTGRCLVHRSELMALGGAWAEATEQASLACERFAQALDPEAVGEGHYQQAEVHRLRGENAAAARAYGEANRFGCEPQPGLALLRLQEGKVDVASSSIQRVLDATQDPLQRARVLPALVEISLGGGENTRARSACAELEDISARFGTEVLKAMAARARGALLLSEGDAQAATEPLAQAFRTWQRIGAPYIAARIRVLLARAYRALGDKDGAALEEEAARRVFQELGATRDLDARSRTDPRPATHDRGGLTARQLEVLRLVARGKTNKEIAQGLGLSEKTVDRHISNIFLRIEVSSRAAATSFAYEHGLI